MKLNRRNKLLIGLCTVAIILIIKLFSIQIIDDKYKMDAENNSMVYSTIFPTRGIINDRYGNILVGNKVAYDLLVTPREIEQFDTLTFCKVLDVTPEFVREKMEEFRKNRRKIGYQSVVMLKQIPPETYMRFAEVAYKFPGFRGQARSIREYPFNAGGNLLGYVSEVDAVNPDGGFIRYGLVKNDYVLVKGSVPGPTKRLVILRQAIRPKKADEAAPQIEFISTASKQGV